MEGDKLPPQATPFIGRADELAHIAVLLSDPTCRLLTLTGPGGIGKTRLALQVAAAQRAHYPHGVFFANLASVSSAALLATAIAAALDIPCYGMEEPSVQLCRHLRDKMLLLLLDNFEHLLEGAGLLVDLLACAPHLKLLVTSRERLNVREEWVQPIDGLPYPSQQDTDNVEEYSAIHLFQQSAQRVQPTFSLTADLPAVITICQQVEGMPLGLELAASWLRIMPPHQISAQLERSLDFLTTTLRNMPERHRSLRTVFDHSWALLSEQERAALMRLAMFRGGFDLDAAQQVAGASLVILAALVDKSLIRVNPSGRYDLHELLRQYAAEKLTESGEGALTAHHHLDFFVGLAQQAEAEVYGPRQTLWFDRLESEQGNLHAALAWSLDGGQAEKGLRLAAALGWFWQLRMDHRQASRWYEKLLAADPGSVSEEQAFIRAKALHRAAEIETHLKNTVGANRLAHELLTLARAANDRWNAAWALAALGLAGAHNNSVEIEALEESLSLFRELGDAWGISHVLRRLALILDWTADYQRAAVLAEEALMLARAAKDKSALAWSLYALAFAQWQMDHDHQRAILLLQESLPLFREIRDDSGLVMALDLLGCLLILHRAYTDARQILEEDVKLTLDLTWMPTLTSANSLTGLAVLTWQQGDRVAAIKLLAVAEQLTGDYFGEVRSMSSMSILGKLVEDIHAQARDPQFASAWAEGRTLTLAEAVALALRDSAPEPASIEPALDEPLSERELEVLRLLGEGLSNARIAQKLYVSPGTIKSHTRNIYSKLSVNNRTQAVTRGQKLHLL